MTRPLPVLPTSVDTHCPYCALQCAMTLTRDHAGTVTVAGRDFPTNRGGLCRKGWTAARLLDRGDRLAAPLLRDPDGVHRPISWERAYAIIVDRIRSAQATGGPDAVGV